MLHSEHPTLAANARAVVGHVARWRSTLVPSPGASSWLHHDDFGERSEQLAGHLEGILDLAGQGRFPSSLALARTALEHHVLDRLLLLADRYTEMIRPEDPAVIQTWEAEWEAKSEGWTNGVVSFDRVKNGTAVRLVRTGYVVRDDAGVERERVSPYSPALDHYNALLGHPDLQASVNQPFDDLEDRAGWARRNQAIYGAFIRWGSLCSNLELCELLTPLELVQLKVHYSFLSAFTHATKSGYDLGRINRPGAPSSDHLLGELALLYVTVIALNEIRAWETYITARPHLLQPLPSDLLDDAEEARAITNYFWLLEGEPQPFDFYQEANRRAHPRLLAGERPDVRPEDLRPEDVSYYPNPYERLARMHIGENEMMSGFGVSPAWSTLHW